MGSPAVSCSSRMSIFWTTSGVFFQGLSSPTGFTDATPLDLLNEQLLPAAGHGVRVEAEELCQDGIATVAELERLQSGIQAALLFIEQAGEQEDGGFHFVRGDFQARGVDHGGEGLGTMPCEPLPVSGSRMDRGIEVKTGDRCAGDFLLLDELMQSVVNFDVQGLSQLLREITLGGMMDKGLGGGQQ